nr:wiskott-Aldrich syndrome protein family member 1-like [Parasteatoda tepidariorum]
MEMLEVREYREGKEKSQAMRDIHAWYAQEERKRAQLYQKRKDEEEVKRKNEERQRIIEEASAIATRLAHEQTIVLTNRFIDRMSQGASFEEARNQLGTDIEERSEELRRSIQDSLNQSFPPEEVEVVSSLVSSPPGSPIHQPTPPVQQEDQDLTQSPQGAPSPSPATPLRSVTPPPQSVPPAPVQQSPPPAVQQSPPPAVQQSPPPAVQQYPPPAVQQSPPPAVQQSPPPAVQQPPHPSVQQPPPPAVQQLPQRRRPGNPGRRSTRLAMLTEASLAFLKVGPYIDRLRTRPLKSSYYTA